MGRKKGFRPTRRTNANHRRATGEPCAERTQYEESIKPKPTSDLRPEYDLSRLGSGVRGSTTTGNLGQQPGFLIEPDLAVVFPDAKSVNRALRLLADAAQAGATRSERGRQFFT